MPKPTRDRAFVPQGWPTVIPRIVVAGANDLVEFITRVFDASAEANEGGPTVVWLAECAILVSEAGIRPPMPAFLYVYVADVDTTYRRAVDAGGRVIEEPMEVAYGDRRAMVEDPWHNTWQIATARHRVA